MLLLSLLTDSTETKPTNKIQQHEYKCWKLSETYSFTEVNTNI